MELREQIRDKCKRVSSEVGLSLDPSSATFSLCGLQKTTYRFRALVSLFVKLGQ